MENKSKIVVYGTTDHGLDIYYPHTERLTYAIDDILEYLKNGTPVHPGSLVAIEFQTAVALARGQAVGVPIEGQ